MMKNKLTETEYKILTALLRARGELRNSEIKKICGLTDPTLAKYLKKLSDEKYILRRINRMKGEYPHPVFYKIDDDIETLKKLVKRFSGTLDEWLFHQSPYVQEKITKNLLKYIVKSWYPHKSIPSPESDFVYIPSKEEEVFTVEDTLNILRLSPTALKNALDEQKPYTNVLGLNEILTLSLLLDTRHLPMDNCILARIEFKLYGKLLKTDVKMGCPEEKKLYDTISGNPVRPKEFNPMKISEENESVGVKTWEEAMESKLLFKQDFLPIMKKRIFITA